MVGRTHLLERRPVALVVLGECSWQASGLLSWVYEPGALMLSVGRLAQTILARLLALERF